MIYKPVTLSIALITIVFTIFACSSDNNDVESLYEDLSYSDIGTYTSDMSSQEIDNSDGNRIEEGTVMAYRTSSNYLGKLVIVVNDGSNNNGITINYTTFDDDGDILVDNEAVTIRGTHLYSLDDGSNDLFMKNQTDSNRNIEPRNGSEFTTVGIDPAYE